jgi:hypothetical protein
MQHSKIDGQQYLVVPHAWLNLHVVTLRIHPEAFVYTDIERHSFHRRR